VTDSQDSPVDNLSRANLVPMNTEFAAGPWKITVQQVTTGNDATQAVTGASQFNDPPADGHTYVVAKIKVMNAGDRTYWIDQDDFAVVGSSGLVHRFVGAIPPSPPLQGWVKAGESQNGWVVAGAASDDKDLVLMFDSLSITGIWSDAVFALQDGAKVADASGRAKSVNSVGRKVDQPAGQGDEVVTKNWAITISQIVLGEDVVGLYPSSDYRTTALEGAQPGSANQWVAVNFRITNNMSGGSPAFFPATAFALAQDDGNAVPDISILTPPDPDAAGMYYPGASRDGWVVFELPLDFGGTVFRFLPFRTDSDPRYLTWGSGQTSAPEPTPGTTVAAGGTVVVSEDVVNLRKSPSTSADIVEELHQGDQLTVTGAPVSGGDYEWYPVKDTTNDKSGYVATKFVEPAS
jgi:hypothetical protein